jgi:hypothetical protein
MDGLKMKYFVLNPTKDDSYGHASRQAMRTYAKEIWAENPELSNDLFRWASDAETEKTDNKKNAIDSAALRE